LIFLWSLSFYQGKESDNPPNKKLKVSSFWEILSIQKASFSNAQIHWLLLKTSHLSLNVLCAPPRPEGRAMANRTAESSAQPTLTQRFFKGPLTIAG
jgi:hypothetical protein